MLITQAILSLAHFLKPLANPEFFIDRTIFFECTFVINPQHINMDFY
jgi:hypothetical protein